MSTETSNRSALTAVVGARDALRAYRRNYHLALTIAHDAGWSDEEIADVLGTKPLYIANTLRNHKADTCGCLEGRTA